MVLYMLDYFDSHKNVHHSNRAAVYFGLVRDRDSLEPNQTNTKNAGDDYRYIRHFVRADYGDLQVRTLTAIYPICLMKQPGSTKSPLRSSHYEKMIHSAQLKMNIIAFTCYSIDLLPHF